ncbi:MAG: hypothetical protein Q8908_15580, partial [Bacteroidota bacterium]|nr:hypothetical protein [Bacteroidota bacterium]
IVYQKKNHHSMYQPIKSLSHDEIQNILSDHDQRIIFEKTNNIPQERDLHQLLDAYVDYKNINLRSVLGIDIYQYSTYGEFEQTLIPFVFKTIFAATIRLCLENHKFIFQEYDQARIERNFISTGDGGFLIFSTPLHALLFASNFAIVLRIYNAYHFYPKLRSIIGGMSVRYAITYEKIYSFEKNFYGRAIINCARILQRDSLNRCLIDENVHRWFTLNMDGLENLQVITIEDIANISYFHEFNSELAKIHTDTIFGKNATRKEGIINSDIQKIGKIQSKETELNIYNLHLQVSMKLYNDDDPTQTKLVTVSLGNLNTSGI